MKRTAIAILVILMGVSALAQTAWDSGEFVITYGSPFPTETWDVAGSFLNTDIPGEGVGGFEVSLVDTNLLVLLAYEVYLQDTLALADAFLVVMQGSAAVSPGTYTVSPVPGDLRLFGWLQGVAPTLIAGLLDESFDFDVLAELNPYLSVSGSISVAAIGPSSLSLSFSGMMINTNLAFVNIASGSFNLENSLPIPLYSLGSLNFSENAVPGVVSGELNPLLSDEGVGAFYLSANDTLSYTLVAYADQGANLYDIFAVEIVGAATLFPETGFDLSLALTLDPTVSPRVTPLVGHDIDQTLLLAILQDGGTPGLEPPDEFYGPLGLGNAQFTKTDGDQLALSFDNLLMANLGGGSLFMSQEWLVANAWPTVIVGDSKPSLPDAQILVGAPYPNPFNSSTVLPIELAESQKLELIVYNILGQEKISLDLGQLSAGKHLQPFDLKGQGLSAGLYYFEVAAESKPSAYGTFLYLK